MPPTVLAEAGEMIEEAGRCLLLTQSGHSILNVVAAQSVTARPHSADRKFLL